MNDFEKIMIRGIQLAELGLGKVSPNPLVGCVVMKDDKIIGEGWHKVYGESHAEVNALKDIDAEGSTVFVTLEPCSHFGKTPPCADFLIQKKVKKVLIASLDPNPLVNGRGIQKLKDAGIEIEMNCLEKEAKWMNRRFFTFFNKQRPYIILKWAQTFNGSIADKNFRSQWISNKYSRKIVHKWRTEEDAVLVGYNTALYDNPLLTARDWEGRNPTRIVLDEYNALSDANIHIFNTDANTLIFNSIIEKEIKNCRWIRLEKEYFIENLLKTLHTLHIQSVLVEGGSKTLSKFIHKNIWDEARVFYCSQKMDIGVAAPSLNGDIIQNDSIFDDTLLVYKNNEV